MIQRVVVFFCLGLVSVPVPARDFDPSRDVNWHTQNKINELRYEMLKPRESSTGRTEQREATQQQIADLKAELRKQDERIRKLETLLSPASKPE